jgi:hypothetical protein
MRFAVLAYLGLAAAAQAETVIASYAESSGSLPPAYAWNYEVHYVTDGTVTTRYCKGYGEDAPHCATRLDTLPSEKFAALRAAIDPIAADLSAKPILALKMLPLGGGSITGHIFVGAEDIYLPPFPVEVDVPRVEAALAVLREFIPAGAIEDVKSRAQPTQ